MRINPYQGINHQGLDVRIVGRRVEHPVLGRPSGQGIAAAAALTESLAAMGGGRLARKGVYRFASHNEAERQQQIDLAQSMADLAAVRHHG